MLNIDSWIRFALTEIYAVLLLVFIFRHPLAEEKRNVWLKILLVMLAMYLGHLFYVLLSPTYFFRRFSFSTERLNLVPFRVYCFIRVSPGKSRSASLRRLRLYSLCLLSSPNCSTTGFQTWTTSS